MVHLMGPISLRSRPIFVLLSSLTLLNAIECPELRFEPSLHAKFP